MPTVSEDMPAISCIPDLYCVIITPRSDTLTIGGPYYPMYIIGMPPIGVEEHSQGNGRRGRSRSRTKGRRRWELLRGHQPGDTSTCNCQSRDAQPQDYRATGDPLVMQPSLT